MSCEVLLGWDTLGKCWISTEMIAIGTWSLAQYVFLSASRLLAERCTNVCS